MQMSDVPVYSEGKRGCGYRKAGGLYLRCEGEGRPCGRFPLRLSVCPTCGEGIRQTRGWKWVDPVHLFASTPCSLVGRDSCGDCPASEANLPLMGKAGLLWVGAKFYPTPHDFNVESGTMGISRRIHTVPKDFVVGKTWVLLAHPAAFTEPCGPCKGVGSYPREDTSAPSDACELCDGTGRVPVPAIFRAFLPSRIEYVCRGDETEEELDKLVKRGLTPVRVEQASGPLLQDDDGTEPDGFDTVDPDDPSTFGRVPNGYGEDPEEDEEEEPEPEEEPVDPCRLCGGPLVLVGPLGDRLQWRCEACRVDFTREMGPGPGVVGLIDLDTLPPVSEEPDLEEAMRAAAEEVEVADPRDPLPTLNPCPVCDGEMRQVGEPRNGRVSYRCAGSCNVTVTRDAETTGVR